jgi:hypothetical protein
VGPLSRHEPAEEEDHAIPAPESQLGLDGGRVTVAPVAMEIDARAEDVHRRHLEGGALERGPHTSGGEVAHGQEELGLGEGPRQLCPHAGDRERHEQLGAVDDDRVAEPGAPKAGAEER